MWSPAKIPEFAKALGRAKGEFNKASQEFTAAATAKTNAAPVKQVAFNAPQTPTIKTKDAILVETAQKIGIPTNGKIREQISEEISVKAKLLGDAHWRFVPVYCFSCVG
jgi:sec-independent protein translocase protein TatA